jgi:hypothetical protein
MGAFVVALLVNLASYVVGRFLRERVKKKKDPPPPGIDPDSMPTVTEAKAIPKVWGTVLLRGLNVLWYGRHGTHEMKRDGQRIGYKHYLSVQYGLCSGPIDRVEALQWDDLEPPLSGRVNGLHYDRLWYRKGALFGGDDGGGGFCGEIRAYKGNAVQPSDDDLELKIGDSLPGYPYLAYLNVLGHPYPHTLEHPCIIPQLYGLTCPCSEMTLWDYCVTFRSAYIGTSPVLQSMSAVVRRVDVCNPLSLEDGKHDLDGDANPANIIWDVLTSTIDGLGLTEAMGLDRASFVAAGNVLAEEEFGLSMGLFDAQDAKTFIQEVLRHIDGVLAIHPTTGLLQLQLIRGGYAVSSLPVLGPDQIRSLNFMRPDLQVTSNSVRITYTDREQHYTERVVTAQDLAGIQARGGFQSIEEVSYPGVHKAALAQRLAARDLKVASYPWARISLTADRTGWALRQGSLFVLNWPILGVRDMVCRVTKASPGELVEGDVDLDAIEDVFGVDWTGYAPIPPNAWDDPFTGGE